MKLTNGDCLEVMQEIQTESIDMILADLPYGTTDCEWDNIIPFTPLWEQYKRIIKKGGAIVLFASQPFTTKLINSNLKWFRYEYIWAKTRATGFLNCRRLPLKKHENICVFYEQLPTYNPQGLIEIEPKLNVRKSRKPGIIKNVPVGEYITKYKNYPTSILEFKSVSKTVHSTQKPVSLGEFLIKTYTNKGEIVLDNTMGSGTFGVSAINTGRDFIGIEKDKEIFEIAKNRIDKAISEKGKIKIDYTISKKRLGG